MAGIDWDEFSDEFQGKGTFYALVLCKKDGTPCHVFTEFHDPLEAAECTKPGSLFGDILDESGDEYTYFIVETTKAFVLDPCHSIYHVGRELSEIIVPRDEPVGSMECVNDA